MNQEVKKLPIINEVISKEIHERALRGLPIAGDTQKEVEPTTGN